MQYPGKYIPRAGVLDDDLRSKAQDMEKIWVQFRESDYQIYHNYCFRYYTVYNTTRKRSIHLFLELFEKNKLPVREHDLEEIFTFFSQKCDELQEDQNFFGKNNPSTDLSRFQVCRDLLFLIEDFEKIYLLIQKTGIISNYYLILATFSKIIEKEENAKSAYISAINEYDRKKIDAVAPVIAKIIRTRLGPDIGWEPVLQEIIRVVRKFNLVSTDQRIDWNSTFLLGSAAVSYLNPGTGSAEIQSTFERYVRESELAEFESILNKTPYLPDVASDLDTSSSDLFEALKSISGSDVDGRYYETVSDPGLPKSAAISPFDLQSVTSRNSKATTPSGQTFGYPHKSREKHSRTFEIDVSDTLQSLVVLPEKKTNPYYSAILKPGKSRYPLLAAGFLIFILLAVAIVPVFGIWNPVNIMNHTGTEMNSNVSNPLGLQKNFSLSSKNDLVKDTIPEHPPTNSLGTVSTSMRSNVSTKTNLKNQSLTTNTALSSAVINKFFMNIAFGPDNTIIEKPDETRISLAIKGAYDDNDTATIDQFEAQFNNVSRTNKFTFDKTSDIATIKITFLPGTAMDNIMDSNASALTPTISDTGVITYIKGNLVTPYLNENLLYINSDFNGDQRKHWIMRGVLSELGFVGETTDYPDSIFYSGSDNTTQLSDLDWKAVGLMYGSKITPGMSFDRVKAFYS
jgi:hypothetical protein